MIIRPRFIPSANSQIPLAPSGVVIPELVETDNFVSDTSSVGGYTETLQVGAPDSNRAIFIAFNAYQNTSPDIATLTVDGITPSFVHNTTVDNGAEVIHSYLLGLHQSELPDPSVTDVDFSVTRTSQNFRGCLLTAWRAIGYSVTATDTGGGSAADPVSDTLNTTSNGIALASVMAVSDTTAITWGGVTQDYSQTLFFNHRAGHASASGLSAGTLEISAQYSGTAANTALACATFPVG